MRIRCTLVFLVVVATLALASKSQSLDDLKTRAETAHPDEKASLCLEIAERQVSNADELFRKSDPDAAQAALRDVVSYSQQARDAASVTGHKLKGTEISVRKMIHKLSDMKRQLTFDEQAPVQSTIDELEKVRTDLLNRMFKGGK
jgi:hypothetical protein